MQWLTIKGLRINTNLSSPGARCFSFVRPNRVKLIPCTCLLRDILWIPFFRCIGLPYDQFIPTLPHMNWHQPNLTHINNYSQLDWNPKRIIPSTTIKLEGHRSFEILGRRVILIKLFDLLLFELIDCIVVCSQWLFKDYNHSHQLKLGNLITIISYSEKALA